MHEYVSFIFYISLISYVLRWTRRPILQQDFISLIILSNYLDMENGPLWTACRTNGYAYGVSFDFDFENNLILLAINQCSQVKLAYSSALTTINELVQHRPVRIDVKRFHAARNLSVCMLTEHVSTLGRATSVCIRSYLNSYSMEKYQDLLMKINAYEWNEEDMFPIVQRYLGPLIDDQQSSTLVLVNSNKMKDTQDFLLKQYQLRNVILIKDVVKHFNRRDEVKPMIKC
jgi:Zn-dependent M16 (insulinase) family peptidase